MNSKGVALIIVIWVIAFLSILAVEFCFGTRTDLNMMKNLKEEIELYYSAQGGIQWAIAQLIYKHDQRIKELRKAILIEEEGNDLKKEWMVDGRIYKIPLENGECEVKVMAEDGKININMVSETVLRKIIGNLGLEESLRDGIVDSILDWIDPDDFYRLNGAENDYYQSLKEPYPCKNSPLDFIEELLLIKGINKDLFFGSKSTEGIGLKDIFSVYAMGEMVNINHATPIVLKTILGLPEPIIQSILTGRKEREFRNQMELLQRVPDLSTFMGEIGRKVLYSSNHPFYTIESRVKGLENRMYGIKAVVKIDAREKNRYKIVQWIDRTN
ncbi:MAG: general secretion pathway protein GspK [Thermodesulfobacteriota bacterium]